MIKLENTEEAINGLAKLITQDPTYPARLRKIQYDTINSKGMENNKEYIEDQEKILKKAEEIGLANTGYIFEIHHKQDDDIQRYMIYKKINNKMIPILEEFEKLETQTIKGLEEVIKYSTKLNISKLITFEISDQDSFYSCPWHEGESDDDFKYGYHAFHDEAIFNKEELNILKENNIKLSKLDNKTAWKFNLELEDIN